MCSRFSLTSPPEAVRQVFALQNTLDFPPRYNIAPTQPVCIVRHDLKGQRVLDLVRWGLIPSWSKDPTQLSTLINARAETAAQKPSFRAPMRHKRCLLPTDGFYEWTGAKGQKQPHLIQLKPDAGGHPPLMAFAGIWEHWMGADGSELETMAILTVSANAEMRAVHDRMPLILTEGDFETWLDCSSGSSAHIAPLLERPQDGILQIRPVSRLLNNPRHEGPSVQDAPDGSLL